LACVWNLLLCERGEPKWTILSMTLGRPAPRRSLPSYLFAISLRYSYNLVQSGARTSFAMILYSKRLNALAEAAIVEALRLDAQEAPQKEVE